MQNVRGLYAVLAVATLVTAVACGGDDGQTRNLACGASGTHSSTGDDGRCHCDPGYEWLNPDDADDSRCRSTTAADVVPPGDTDAGDETALGADTSPDEPAQPDVVTPVGCVTEAICAATTDCQQGERCNLTLQPPRCQKLYCATLGQACDPTQGDALCEQGLTCVLAAQPYCCKADCDQRECGPDGCAGSCGTCPGAHDACENGQCVCQPACEGKACGDDGCGGFCGAGACGCGEGNGNELGVGEACTKGGGECSDGLECSADGMLAEILDGENFCTKTCQAAADCGPQARCCSSFPVCVLETCAPLVPFACDPK